MLAQTVGALLPESSEETEMLAQAQTVAEKVAAVAERVSAMAQTVQATGSIRNYCLQSRQAEVQPAVGQPHLMQTSDFIHTPAALPICVFVVSGSVFAAFCSPRCGTRGEEPLLLV
eukprot:gnl/TRDRNA2_/TRDRNA2_118965_c1_seq1.p1 gnl/TRDRNA2_/TRDRNA2_118965_c1~~gnl/TRDRNA2_/TRDRNA2_118965_c1_seq1.p1  ORF type:complete len:126 (+),score=27.09 gnl/TRDRNA2_/TRDRNA2_118965_c1_seq1:31-378(+)